MTRLDLLTGYIQGYLTEGELLEMLDRLDEENHKWWLH